MKKITKKALRIAHAVSHPVSGLFLHNSHRTRVLLIVGNEVLLIKTSFGHQQWSLPGGGIKRNEGAMQCAVREVKEETGIVLQLQSLAELGVVRLPKERTWPKQELHFFLATLSKKPSTSIKRPLEIMETKWFDISALPSGRSATVDEGLSLLSTKAML